MVSDRPVLKQKTSSASWFKKNIL